MKNRKKTKLVLVALLAVVTIVSALMCGCSLFDNFDEVQSISLIGTPKTVYAVGDEFDPAGAKVEISYKDKTEGVTKALTADNFDIQFSTAKTGTYKCVVAYKDGGKVYNDITLSFDYSVVAKDGAFTEGDGSQSSPYVVYTAEQFAQIGVERGNYYVLGDNIDFTGVDAYVKLGAKVYNKNSNAFYLDGQGYSLTVGGREIYAFYALNGSTVKNLVFNIKPGSVEVALTLYAQGTENVFENITMNGSMKALQNDGLLAIYVRYCDIVARNCVSNVNILGSASPYYGVFFGFVADYVKNVTFENCVNNGDIDGTTAWIFIGNYSSKNIRGKINVRNCSNTGRVVGASVGLFNTSAYNVVGTRIEKSDYPVGDQEKIGEIDFAYEESDFVAIPYLLYKDNHDVTLVKKDGVVKFADSVKAKLDGEFGEGNYTVKAVVRDWVNQQKGLDTQTIYVYTKSYGFDFAAPYSYVEQGTATADSLENAISIENNKLVLAGNINGLACSIKSAGTSQYYCYYVYDNTGAMRYCGQIAYADVQNA